MRRLLQPIYALIVVLTFVCSLLLAFPFFLILGLKDAPWARRAITLIIQYWSRGWLLLIGMPVRVSGHFPKDQRFVIVANHISYLDTLNIFAAIPEYFRTLAKKEMVKIPVFGFVYKQVAILVDRSSVFSRGKSMRLMWRQLHHQGHIVIFPEGTFNETPAPTKEFFDGAFSLAIKAQTPILPLIFPDTVHRWHYSAWWKFWPGRNRAIFLEPVPVDGLTHDDLHTLRDEVRRRMDEALIQYAPSH